MKKTTIFLIIVLLQTITLFAGNEDDTLSKQKRCFYDAKIELENMLSGKVPLDYERAVFITENAYWNNEFDYSVFQVVIDFHAKNIKNLAEVNRNESVQNFKATLLETEEQKREKYQNLLYNWAIFTYLTDTTILKTTLNDKNYIFQHLPYEYSYNDPLGVLNWKNSQVFNLLDNNKANCYAMTSFFKILAERLQTDASIGVAPGHVYITHIDQKGTHYNVELANRSFPGAGSIMTLTYTPVEAVRNGIAMRTLDLKQSVALCLIYLAKGYEHKFDTKTDDFLYQCAETTLKYDSLNLNAMLLKAEVLEEKVVNSNKTIAQLQTNKEFKEYQNLIITLFEKGYREMPLDMKNLIINRLQKDSIGLIITDHTPKGFQTINPKDDRYATLSWGLFDEIHEPKLIEQYGRTLLNTKTKKITKFVTADSLYNKYPIDLVVFAWNVDPLASQYPQLSPYVFCADNPIYFVDIDGRVLWDPQAKKEVIYNEESKKFTYADGSELSETYRKQAMPTLQKLTSSDVGVNLVKSMQAISTKIIIDETDKKTIKSNPNANSTVLREVDDNGNFITNSEGLSEVATIVPNWSNITANAKSDNMDIDEKLLATMVVEFGHMSTKEQITLENSLSDIYTNSNSFAQVYNPLMNSAIQSEIAYRKEKGQTIDKSVFGFYNKISTQEIGKGLKLSEENQKIYDSLK